MNDEFDEFKEIINLDRLIHEPARLAIMAVLSACKSADFTYLLNTTGLTKGNLSAQLRKLEEGEYLTITKGFIQDLFKEVSHLVHLCPRHVRKRAHWENQ